MKKLVSLIIAAILMLVTIFVYGSRIKLPVITGEKLMKHIKQILTKEMHRLKF